MNKGYCIISCYRHTVG